MLGVINDQCLKYLYYFPVMTAEDYAAEIKQEFLTCNTEKNKSEAQGI